ncbi:RND superfamily putative drug exporter [Kibdelosporangium banguiense]|uniref:RND superfamily putative drug exporter n=1 Tax=Kibdelosporangium banguiense TaxID=1365924 RepID=A0ABS4TGA4_9PSEU|nr:MMPL family transporter [Kibdelosporangium banguiense]MBP2323440.1 RND superfamily putative drug exporter [Kibdelosporangium banguiense]
MVDGTEKTADLRPAATKAGLAAAPPVNRLLRLTLAWPKTILLMTLLLAAGMGVFGAGALSELKTGGYDAPGAESVRGQEILAERFPHANPNLVVLVANPGGSVADPDVTEIGREVTHRLAVTPDVTVGSSYWDTPIAELRSDGGEAGLILARVGGGEDEVADVTKRLHDELAGWRGPVRVQFGGLAQVENDVNTQAAADLVKAESVAIPLTLVLLLFVFGTVVAAGVPLLIGLMAIAGTLGVLRAMASVVDVSVFSVNLAAALGLGLAVDYSLLFVSRYREERRRHPDATFALAATMRTAGRTIVFSALTVAVALCSLLVFQQYFLRSFAYAGVGVVGVTVVGATIVLPALLAIVGDRIDSFALPGRRIRRDRAAGFWGGVAGLVLRRPVLTATPVVALLLVLAAPFLHVQFGIADERVLPRSAESREVTDRVRDDFGSTGNGSLAVVGEQWGDTLDAKQAVAEYGQRVSLVPGVTRVDSAAGSFAHGVLMQPPMPGGEQQFRSGEVIWLSVLSGVEPYSSEGAQLARDVRAVPVPKDRRVFVTGQGAQLADVTKSIADRLPYALALIALSTFVLLFMMTGSLLLPLNALVLNLLGLGAVFGAMVWVFQDGHLSGLLGFTPAPLAVVIPVLLFCAIFGISTDYQVFVLARIKEQHDAGADLNGAVVHGLSRSGPVITAAAAILCVSFLAMLASRVSLIQLLGLGASLAVLLDAFLIRPVLVTALMRLSGRWSWWAPRPLRALHNRFALRE